MKTDTKFKKWGIPPVGIFVPIGISSTMIFEFFNFIYTTITLFPPIGALIILLFILGMQRLYNIHKNGQSIYRYLLMGLIVTLFVCFFSISCLSILKFSINGISISWIIDICLLVAFIEGMYIGQKIFQPLKSILMLTKVLYITAILAILLLLNQFGIVLISILLQYKTTLVDSYFFNVVCLIVILIVDFMILGFFVPKWVNQLAVYFMSKTNLSDILE